MGLFDIISSSIREGKERAAREKAAFEEKINYLNLEDACFLAVREFGQGSLPMKVSINQIIRRKIQNEKDSDDLYRAFESMYVLFKRKHNDCALNMSQWIGAKLYQENDHRIKVVEHDDGRKFFIPDNI